MSIVLILTEVLEKLVLLSLLGLSIWSISIIIAARRKFRAFASWGQDQSDQVETMIKTSQWEKLAEWARKNPQLMTAGAMEQAIEAPTSGVDRSVRSFLTREKMRLESGMSVLATLGANAPFIGLFGTVLGIIRSFAALADNQGSANSVMSGISQALYATAAGLFVAIPAVIAYNTFSSKIRSQMMSADVLKDLYLAYRTTP